MDIRRRLRKTLFAGAVVFGMLLATVYTKGINGAASTNAGAEAVTLTSTEEEKKKALRLVYWDVGSNAMLANIWVERERLAENIPLEVLADAMPERVVEIDHEIPVGETLKVILTPQVAGSQGTLDGALEYEIV